MEAMAGRKHTGIDPRSGRGHGTGQIQPGCSLIAGFSGYSGRSGLALKAGDLIFRIDGQIVQAQRPEDVEVFGNMIKQYRIDSKVVFEIWRDGNLLELNATLDKRPTPSNELPEYEDKLLEYTVRELSFGDQVFLRIQKEGHGVLVDNVESADGQHLQV